MKTALTLIAAATLVACSSTPEATEAEATATAVATATAEVEPTATAPAPTATATATATASAPPPPEPAADLAVLPMKIVVNPKTPLELKADKGVYMGPKKIASFDKNTMALEGMKDSMVVLKDGSIVTQPPSPKKMKFNDKDEVEIEGGGKIAIDDKGKVTMVPPDGKTPPKGPAPVITGFKPEGRRAASLTLVLAMMTMGAEPVPPPPPAKGGPAPKDAKPTSAPPAMTGSAPTKK